MCHLLRAALWVLHLASLWSPIPRSVRQKVMQPLRASVVVRPGAMGGVRTCGSICVHADESRAVGRIESVPSGRRCLSESTSPAAVCLSPAASESRHCSRALILTDGFHKRAHARRADTPCPHSITRWWPTHPLPLPRCPRALSNAPPKVSRRTSKRLNQGTLPTSQTPLALLWHKVARVQRIWELEPGTGTLSQWTSVVLAKGLQGTCISFTKCNGWRVRRSGNATTIANYAMRPLVGPSALVSIRACAISADPRRHETLNLDWNAEFRNAEFRFSQLLYQGQTLVVERKLFLKIYFWSILQKCSLCSMPTSAIRWMANIASVWTLPSSRRSDSPCLCVRVVRVRVCTSPVTLAHE